MNACDAIGREINVGDYVFSYNNLYEVLWIGTPSPPREGVTQGYAKIILLDKSKTTRALQRHTKEMVIVPKGDVLIWLLKDRH